jgi:8-oxo-dGTP pyrophosphatase MutT (NUDIX family)
VTVPAPPTPFLDPEVVPADAHRRAARLVLLDDRDRVLLEHVRVHPHPEQGSWWELPGGGIEPGESTAEAAAREVAEETGYVDVAVGPVLATGRVRYRDAVRVAEQHTHYHVGRLRSDRRRVSTIEGHEAAGLLEVAWLTVDEVTDGLRLDLPEIAQLVRDAVAGRLTPRRLVDRDVLRWSDVDPLGTDLPDGAVARVVGDRVVRDAAPWTPAVHAWLAHLHDRGVDAVPAPLGVDEHGREAVTFVPGDTSAHAAWPAPLRTLDGMAAIGALLRRLADAVDGFAAPADAVWRTGPGGPAPGQVVAHGDVGHGNVVWRPDGSPALIDWEFAHPAPASADLAAAAAWLVPLITFDHERRGFDRDPDRRARLHALCRGAGVSPTDVLDALPAHLAWERDRVRELGALEVRPFAHYLELGQPAGFDRVAAYVREHATQLR